MLSFSLTLVDSLDTLAVSITAHTHVLITFSQVLGDIAEFSRAVRLVLENVKFNADLTVSVFETNIRMLG